MELGGVVLVLIGQMLVGAVSCVGNGAASPSTGNPCFAGAPPLIADKVHEQFEPHAELSWAGSGNGPPPAETFGTCTVHDGKIRAADGTVVAQIDCGLDIHTRGIRDSLGIEVGARGADVLAAWTRPHGPMVCVGNGPSQTRCRFKRTHAHELPATSYVIAGSLPSGSDALSGLPAERFFAEREIVHIGHNVWCH